MESCHLLSSMGPRGWGGGGCLKVSLAISLRVSEMCGVLLFDICHVLLLGLCSNPGDANVKFLHGTML